MIKKLLMLSALFSAHVFAAPVNINTADAKTIADSLSGIGLKKAQTIVDYRAKNGDFKAIEDLQKVSGIGAKTIEKNKADILLSDPSTTSTPPVAPSDQPNAEAPVKSEPPANTEKKPDPGKKQK
jgi:competence protein ComEA